MVSAISLCFLALGLSAVSSQLISSESESPDAPLLERRTFKHGKPVKILPLVKKHKKFSGLVPHVFGKTSYSEIPIIHETPKPVYKFHRYQGIEVKPVSDIIFSTPEPIIETHSVEPPSGDFIPSLSSDHHFLPPVPSSVLLYPINDKPVFSAPIPVYASLPPPPAKPIYSLVPAPPQPVFSSLPITSISPPSFSAISIPRPAPSVIPPSAPVFTPIPAPFPSNPPPPPPQPIFTSIPIKFQNPVLPPLPAPSPAPVFSSIPVKIPASVLPSSPSPPPSNIFSSVSIKIPAPVLPSAPTPSPAPVFSSISTVSPTPEPAFSSIPVSLPPPPQFSVLPSPAPSYSAFPPPAPALPSFSASSNSEPEFPYPPSGTPIPSYIKDISLGDVELKDSPLPTYETPKYQEVTPSVITNEGSKNLHHILGAIKNDNGLFQKIKDWKADKASAALNHFTHFKQKPIIQPSISLSHPPNKIPIEIPTPIPTQVPVYPTLQFPGPIQPLPLAPGPVFFPPQFFPSAKYENFPPNNIESPPLLNSYGTPISLDSYVSSHVSHDRLSSAASEEEPAVVPAPSNEKNAQTEQESTQEFQPQNFQTQFQQQEIPQNHPVYVPDTNPTIKEENKTTEDDQLELEDYKTQKETNSESLNYPNHKE